jgi:hypothetical protein
MANSGQDNPVNKNAYSIISGVLAAYYVSRDKFLDGILIGTVILVSFSIIITYFSELNITEIYQKLRKITI